VGLLQEEQLMTEEDFNELYASAITGGSAPKPSQPPATSQQPAVKATKPAAPSSPARRLQAPARDVLAPRQRDAKAPLSVSPSRMVPQPSQEEEELPLLEPEELLEEAPLPEPEARPPEEPAPVADEPITFAEARQLLEQVQDRNDIGRIVLRFAAGRFARTMLLTLQRDLAMGWLGAGALLPAGTAQRVIISLAKPSAFKLVRDTRSHFLGPLKRDGPSIAFLRALHGGAPKSVVIMPILARGRVVNFLYGDNGRGQLASPDIGELLILSQKVAESYTAMISARISAPAAG
jgi:hypothetical protein